MSIEIERCKDSNDSLGCWWWLRTQGESNASEVMYVSNNGFIHVAGGIHVNNFNGGIRPAMWVAL
jgi:hypothetical protein